VEVAAGRGGLRRPGARWSLAVGVALVEVARPRLAAVRVALDELAAVGVVLDGLTALVEVAPVEVARRSAWRLRGARPGVAPVEVACGGGRHGRHGARRVWCPRGAGVGVVLDGLALVQVVPGVAPRRAGPVIEPDAQDNRMYEWSSATPITIGTD
jgi:hypothetical protein